MKISAGIFLKWIYALLLWDLLVVACGQNCGCSSDLCCSQYGYCGTSKAYCGEGCREGPCTAENSNGPLGASNVLSETKTIDLFNSILSGASDKCEGKDFYTVDSFIIAANSFSAFGSTGSTDIARREVAAFLANVVFLVGDFCYINAINLSDSSMIDCDETNILYPCADGKSYHGRGPLQLSWRVFLLSQFTDLF